MIVELEIKDITKNNRGVFTCRDIKDEALLEISPVIILSEKEMILLWGTLLGNYVFKWWGEKSAIALGWGSLFNHSETPNVEYVLNYKEKTIEFYALENIKKGSQLFIDYDYDINESKEFVNIMQKYYSKSSDRYYDKAVKEWTKLGET